jgi:hypothetical protein
MHGTQGAKERLLGEAMRALARFHGYQARTNYAEAFQIFRMREEL